MSAAFFAFSGHGSRCHAGLQGVRLPPGARPGYGGKGPAGQAGACVSQVHPAPASLSDPGAAGAGLQVFAP
jgi:hypothetical protein